MSLLYFLTVKILLFLIWFTWISQCGFVLPNVNNATIERVKTKSCTVGQRLMNEDIMCTCYRNYQYTCTPLTQASRKHSFPIEALRTIIAGAAGGMENHKYSRAGDEEEEPAEDHDTEEHTAESSEVEEDGHDCIPNMHYQREGNLCVCSKHGKWPSQVCIDLFRAMFPVTEIPAAQDMSKGFLCNPGELYITRCSVCQCPEAGVLTLDKCLQRECSNKDGILTDPRDIRQNEQDKYNISAIYSECKVDKLYTVGCRTCTCLMNKRLHCDNCERIYGIYTAILSTSSDTFESIEVKKCKKGTRFINECSWCVCTRTGKYMCMPRNCSENSYNYDLGPWPWPTKLCEPGLVYQELSQVCFCTAQGSWPNPDCRYLFAEILPVEKVENNSVADVTNYKCIINKFYLFGCNVCLCQGSVIDVTKCTANNCAEDDPVFLPSLAIKKSEKYWYTKAIYKICDVNKKYSFGCRKCLCLKNNRLYCNNCEKNYGFSFPEALSSNENTDVKSELCTKEQRAINDCNWCVCYRDTKFVCVKRQCSDVTHDGLFNDTIQEYVAATQGGSLLRSSRTFCQPGMRYQRDDQLCECTEDGDWPSAVCNNLFRGLYEVEIPEGTNSSHLECTPTVLQLQGCNLCSCTPQGHLDPNSCIKMNCSAEDPLLKLDHPLMQDKDPSMQSETTLTNPVKDGDLLNPLMKDDALMKTDNSVVKAKDPIKKDKDPSMEGKDSLVKTKDPLMEDKDPLMEYKDHLIKTKDSLMDDKDLLIKLNHTDLS